MELEKKPSFRRDLGITGAIVVASQLISSFQGSQTLSSEIAKFKEEFQQSLVEREEYFARKADVALVSEKLDKVSDQLIRMSEQIQTLRQETEASNDFLEDDGCGQSAEVTPDAARRDI